MKKLFLLGLFTLIGVFSARAYDFEVDGIYYNIKSDTPEEVEVTHTGEPGNAPYRYSGSVVIPERVTYDGITYRVTAIGGHAFYWCPDLTSVVIPESVTSIGNYAFGICRGLTSVVIPESVTSIGNYAFWSCSGLTSVVIPESVTSIGYAAFEGCTGIINPLYNSRVFAKMPEGYNGAYTIPSGIQSIAGYAFYNCSGLTSVVIPEGVTSIGLWAFRGCSGLTSVVIPEGVTSIGESTFRGCSGLTSVVIPESVTYIGHSAFYDCSGLTSVVLPESVTYMGPSVFVLCPGIRRPIYNSRVFAKLPEDYNGVYRIPDGIQLIAGTAFSRCSGLRSVTIPESVTSIGRWAFLDCSGLRAVTLPRYLEDIGMDVFQDCDSLVSVRSKAKTPPRIGQYSYKDGEYVFVEMEERNEEDRFNYPITLYVPLGSKSAYQSELGWRLFATIEELDETHNEAALTAAPFAYVQGRTVYLSDGLGEVEAFTATGQRVYRGFDRSFTLPQPGVYVLRVVADGRRNKVVVR